MFLYWLEESISNIRHGGFVSLLSVVIVALTAVIVSALILVRNYINREIENLKSEAPIIAFLHDSVIDPSQIKQQIETLPEVAEVIYVSKTEAIERSKTVFGDFGDLMIEGLEELNPLPASLEISVHSQFLDQKIIQTLANSISELDGIEDVTFEQYSSMFVRKAERIIFAFGTLMGLASVVIVSFSIMLTVYFRREEIRVLRMVGADNRFIMIPLIAQGLFLGLIGSAFGILSAFFVFRGVESQIGQLQFISNDQIFLILSIGTALGFLGSLLPIKKYIEV